MSNGEEGIGNAVVIGLIPSTQGLFLSPEGLRYIIVLFFIRMERLLKEVLAQPRIFRARQILELL